MKLTELYLHGFKSFADKTVLKFDDGVTGVVGPNGCGKSNVVDAFRWVLGEQRSSALRSDKMENVIFNGTASRKRSNVAEVRLTFDNSKGVLPSEYTTVAITRKLYRDGESEYRLNDVPCRLKDITSLFLDTGIGPDSYAIIELGMVEEILKDKQNARRQLFEEAAGISRYKIRKKETFSRLKDTEQSLERVEDSLHLLEEQLKDLERQARRAQRYRELKTEYRANSLQLAWLKSRHLREEQATLRGRQAEITDATQQLNTRNSEAEAELQELKRKHLETEDTLKEKRVVFNAFVEDIRKREAERQVQGERAKYLEQRGEDLKARQAGLLEEAEKLEKAIQDLEARISEAQQAVDQQRHAAQGLQEQLEEHQVAAYNRNQEVEGLERQIREQEAALNELEKQQGYADLQIQGLRQEIERSRNQRSERSAELSASEERLTGLQAQLQAAEDARAQLEAQRTEEAAQRRQLEADLDTARSTAQSAQRELDAARHEHDLLKSLVENLEGFPESVQFLSKSGGWAQKPVLLSDIFAVPEPYKAALETFLEPYINHFVVRSREEALAGVHLLRKRGNGRARFFVLEALAPPAAATLPKGIAGSLTPVLEVVDYDAAFAPLAKTLFAGVYFLDDGFDALPTELPENLTLLSPTGALVVQGARVSGGAAGLFAGKRIGRAKELQKLGKALTQKAKAAEEAHNALEKLNAQRFELEQSTTSTDLDDAQKRVAELQSARAKLESTQAAFTSIVAEQGEREAQLTAEIERLSADKLAQEPAAQALLQELEGLRKELTTAQANRDQATETLKATTDAHTHALLALNEADNRLGSLRRETQTTRDRLGNVLADAERMRVAREETREQLLELAGLDTSAEDEIVQLFAEKERRQAALEAEEAEYQALRNAIAKREDALKSQRKAREELETERQRIVEQLSATNEQLSNLTGRLEAEFQIQLKVLTAEEALGDTDPETVDLPALEETVLKQRDKVQRFGEVNLTAIEKHAEVKERFDEIETQRQDLLAAKDDLLDTIAKIDATAEERFMETFNAVREHFVTVFKTLFSQDDEADMILKDPEQPLESPVEIVARPKGKRPLTLAQLSGGEKTLTAVALLFSVYLVKPAPFCIFDEVDAPLDDANIDKFNRIVRRFSQGSQFIIVTHNKRTMVTTDVLYGVTMEQTGVSRVLPVGLKQLELQ